MAYSELRKFLLNGGYLRDLLDEVLKKMKGLFR